LEVGIFDLSVLPKQRSHQDHVVCHARRTVSSLRVRRVPPLSQGVRRASRFETGDADGGYGGDVTARRRRYSAGLRFLIQNRIQLAVAAVAACSGEPSKS